MKTTGHVYCEHRLKTQGSQMSRIVSCSPVLTAIILLENVLVTDFFSLRKLSIIRISFIYLTERNLRLLMVICLISYLYLVVSLKNLFLFYFSFFNIQYCASKCCEYLPIFIRNAVPACTPFVCVCVFFF